MRRSISSLEAPAGVGVPEELPTTSSSGVGVGAGVGDDVGAGDGADVGAGVGDGVSVAFVGVAVGRLVI